MCWDHRYVCFPFDQDLRLHFRKFLGANRTSFQEFLENRTASRFLFRLMARALRTWAINEWGKPSVCNLQYDSRTRLVRDMYSKIHNLNTVIDY